MQALRATRKRRVTALIVTTMLAVFGVSMYPGGAIAAPGNNGTVKIDGIPFDDHPDNEPHVGCLFQVDFYNYDQGNYNALVQFTAHPPTGKQVLLVKDTVFIGEDPAGGGTDLDGSGTYDLSPYLQPFMAHPQQGYHIKLKVRAPGSIGADTKYKTFWVEACDGYPSPY